MTATVESGLQARGLMEKPSFGATGMAIVDKALQGCKEGAHFDDRADEHFEDTQGLFLWYIFWTELRCEVY